MSIPIAWRCRCGETNGAGTDWCCGCGSARKDGDADYRTIWTSDDEKKPPLKTCDICGEKNETVRQRKTPDGDAGDLCRDCWADLQTKYAR